jgi:uncharacterized protein (DUF58 family)
VIPSARLVLAAVAPIFFSLAALADSTLLWPMLAIDLGIAVVAVIDLVLGLPRLVGATRTVPRVLSLGRDNPVTVELTSRSRRALVVRLQDDLPLELTSADLPAEKQLAPGGRATLTYHVRPSRRGAFEIGNHHVRYATPLGFWWRQLRVVARDTARVYPDVRAVRTYDLLARQNREALMARTTRLRGGETEFERLRDHQRDDPFRFIDWKATARRQKLTVREHQKERDQTVVCVLDAGRLMTAESDGLSYFDHALNATLMMGHVAARSGDQIGFLAFDRAVRAYLPPVGGARATQSLLTVAYDLHPALVETDFASAFELLSRRLRKRALVVVFTQVVDDVSARRLLSFMRGLPQRHLPLAVLFRDGEIDALVQGDPDAARGGDVDLYVGGAAAETVLWRDRLVRDLKAGGAQVLHALPRNLTPALVNQYLEIKAQQLL